MKYCMIDKTRECNETCVAYTINTQEKDGTKYKVPFCRRAKVRIGEREKA